MDKLPPRFDFEVYVSHFSDDAGHRSRREGDTLYAELTLDPMQACVLIEDVAARMADSTYEFGAYYDAMYKFIQAQDLKEEFDEFCLTVLGWEKKREVDVAEQPA